MNPEERKAHFAEEDRQIEAAKAELATAYGLERNAKFETAWNIAWEFGHAVSLAEVKYYFGELTPLL